MRDDIKYTCVRGNGGASWEESYQDIFTAENPLSDADVEAIIAEKYPNGWKFPIVKHSISVADDRMSVTVNIIVDKCN